MAAKVENSRLVEILLMKCIIAFLRQLHAFQILLLVSRDICP